MYHRWCRMCIPFMMIGSCTESESSVQKKNFFFWLHEWVNHHEWCARFYTIHDVQKILLIKIDTEQAFDGAHRAYLFNVFKHMGFHSRLIMGIAARVRMPSFSVHVNGSPSPRFTSLMGLRRDCPLSSFLLCFALKCLSPCLKMLSLTGYYTLSS